MKLPDPKDAKRKRSKLKVILWLNMLKQISQITPALHRWKFQEQLKHCTLS